MTCHLCGSTDMRIRCELGAFSVMQCRVCGLGETYPPPSDELIAETNRSIYKVEGRVALYQSRWRAIRARYDTQLNAIRRLQSVPGGKLLDVGCNLGFFLQVARDRGYDAQGVELSPETAEYAREKMRLNVFSGALDAAGFPDAGFDVVTLWDVLEHVPDPKHLLREVRRVLDADGILALQSPNMDSTMADITGARWYWWTVPDHLYHFTPESLIRLLEDSGFDITRVTTSEPLEDLVGNILRSVLRVNSGSGAIKDKIVGRLAGVSARVTWPLVAVFQRAAWKRRRGALLTVHARKNGAGSSAHRERSDAGLESGWPR